MPSSWAQLPTRVSSLGELGAIVPVVLLLAAIIVAIVPMD